MPKPRLYADSSVVIIGLENKESNSSIIMRLVAAGKLEAYTAEKTLEEVRNYFERRDAAREGYFAVQLIKRCFKVIGRDEINASKWRGKIKEKDVEHLASAKKYRLQRIIAFDRDYNKFSEHRTPKEFVEELGITSKTTDY